VALWNKISGEFTLSKLSTLKVLCLQVVESLKGIENYHNKINDQKQEFDDLYDYIINENSLEYDEEEEEEEEFA
jgi:hypothetical protein